MSQAQRGHSRTPQSAGRGAPARRFSGLGGIGTEDRSNRWAPPRNWAISYASLLTARRHRCCGGVGGGSGSRTHSNSIVPTASPAPTPERRGVGTRMLVMYRSPANSQVFRRCYGLVTQALCAGGRGPSRCGLGMTQALPRQHPDPEKRPRAESPTSSPSLQWSLFSWGVLGQTAERRLLSARAIVSFASLIVAS